MPGAGTPVTRDGVAVIQIHQAIQGLSPSLTGRARRGHSAWEGSPPTREASTPTQTNTESAFWRWTIDAIPHPGGRHRATRLPAGSRVTHKDRRSSP